MTHDYPTDKNPATPEYVLSVFQDLHRHDRQYDFGAAMQAAPTFDTPLSEWRYALDFREKLGEYLNAYWNIHCSDSAWRRAIEPIEKRTLRDVCELVAANAQREIIRPVNFLTGKCETAGAFFTVRSLLAEAGANPDDIGPSTPLAKYTLRYPNVFLGHISRITPDRLPPVRVLEGSLGCLAILFGYAASGVMLWEGVPGPLPFAVALASLFFAIWLSLPKSITFGELKTFRDLAVAMTTAR